MSIPLQIIIPPLPKNLTPLRKPWAPFLKNLSLWKPPPPPLGNEPSQKFLSTSGNSLHPSPENIATLLKHFKQSRKKSQPPWHKLNHSKKMLSARKISPPPQKKISTHPDFFVYSSPVFLLLSACLVEFIYKNGQHCDIATWLGTILKQI